MDEGSACAASNHRTLAPIPSYRQPVRGCVRARDNTGRNDLGMVEHGIVRSRAVSITKSSKILLVGS